MIYWDKKEPGRLPGSQKTGKSLIGNHSGEWRYRVGNYQLIAHNNDDTLTILLLDIGHRKDI